MAIEFYGANISAQRSINLLLSLPATGKEQDWEFELSDPDRIDDMMKLAKDNSLNIEEKCALYLIMISSIEDRNHFQPVCAEIVEEVRSLLNDNPIVREAMIFYWLKQSRSSNLDFIRKLFY